MPVLLLMGDSLNFSALDTPVVLYDGNVDTPEAGNGVYVVQANTAAMNQDEVLVCQWSIDGGTTLYEAQTIALPLIGASVAGPSHDFGPIVLPNVGTLYVQFEITGGTTGGTLSAGLVRIHDDPA